MRPRCRASTERRRHAARAVIRPLRPVIAASPGLVMFTYVCLGTNDPARAARFYDAVLATLGQRRCEVTAEWEVAGWRGWGTYERDGATELALWLCPPFDGRPASGGN